MPQWKSLWIDAQRAQDYRGEKAGSACLGLYVGRFGAESIEKCLLRFKDSHQLEWNCVCWGARAFEKHAKGIQQRFRGVGDEWTGQMEARWRHQSPFEVRGVPCKCDCSPTVG